MSGDRRSGSAWTSTPLAIFAFAVLILLGGIAVVVQNEGSYGRARIDQTRGLAQVLAASATAAVDFDDPAAAQQAVDAFKVNDQIRWIGIYGRDGKAIAGYERSRAPIPSTIALIPETPVHMIRVTAPVARSGQQIGTVYMEIEREAPSRKISRYLLLVGLVVLAVLVVIALGFAQGQLRRANRELGKRAEALAEANELLQEQMEERAKAEEQLRQSQKMQALGQLTGGIAHDFNNLLTVIQGSADMLSRPELPEPKRVRFAQAIVQAASNAASLTSQLLAFARRQPLKPEQIDLNALIREMDDMIDRTLGERIEVVTDLSEESCRIEADKGQLQSAILNIISNARDAMSGGGVLTIRTRLVTPTDDRTCMALEIHDTGQGMNAETADRIFEPFFTTKGTGKGTGLGLSQVYGFATQSGGDVEVESAPGEGATLTMTLPCIETPAALRTPNRLIEIAKVRPAKILIVEDNEEVGVFAEALLTELGHDVVRASSGEEALDIARGQRFDVVFSDVVMPGMGGLRLSEILKQEQPQLPVILATGYSQEIAESGSGDRPVILKPYRLSTLSEALAAALHPEIG
ncbi:MAG TPA: ATP-binding protein [Sphingomicrobium sp.]|nr:ATP-binding protein [Sphingomicrobium sp.]